MPGFFLSLLACFVVTLAGREQLRIARLSQALGSTSGMIWLVWSSSIVTSAIAAWLAMTIAPVMPPAGKEMFVAFALVIGGLEVAFLRARRQPKEPTRSSGAILIVLFSAQMADAARFLIMALAILMAEPVMVAAGGILGSGIALTIAAMAAGDWERRAPIRPIAFGVGGMLVLTGLITGLAARGAFG